MSKDNFDEEKNIDIENVSNNTKKESSEVHDEVSCVTDENKDEVNILELEEEKNSIDEGITVKIERVVPLTFDERDDFKVKKWGKRKFRKFEYLPKKQFNKYRDYFDEEHKEDEREIKIVGNAKFYRGEIRKRKEDKPIPDKAIGKILLDAKKPEKQEFRKYYLWEEKDKRTWGYAYIGNDEWIRIQKICIIPFILLLLLLIGLFGILYFGKPEIIEPYIPNIISDQEYDNSEKLDLNKEETHFFVKKSHVIDSENRRITIHNSEENTVYFQIAIYNADTGKKIISLEDKGQVIPPGGNWSPDIYDLVEKGETKVTIVTNCFDVKTGEPCIGNNDSTTIIKK